LDGGLCYVIASWTGPRRCRDPKYEADPLTYVREHLRHLKNLHHGIDKIVVYFPFMKNEPAHITQAIDAMRLNADVFVDVKRRVNLGQSYGSFHDAYEDYRNQGYRWWFFVEDDYVPTQNDFDGIFRNLFESEPGCSLCTPLLVGTEWPDYGFVDGPGAGIGFTSAEVLERIWKRNGGFERFAGEVDYRFDDQLLWGIVFQENGKLLDTRGKYCFAYMAGNWGTRIYHDPRLPLLFAPIQDFELLVNHDLRFGIKNLPLIPAPAEF
jgi:hypothetical protein